MADTAISALPAAAALGGTEPIPVVQAGATKRATPASLATYVIASDAEISALAALTSAANKLPYFTGAGAAALADLTTFVRTLLDDADAATARATLGAEALGTLAGINTQTASYTLALSDVGKVVELSVSSANTVTIPPNSSVAFPIGSRVDVVQYGAGQVTITPGAGVTIRSTPGLKISAQYAAASLYKRGTDEWVAMGSLVA